MSTYNRRKFIKQAALAGAGAWISQSPAPAARRRVSPNEKLNIGVIGVANRGEANLDGVSDETIVALCDVDEKYLNAAAQRFPNAARYSDFRKLLDRNDLDAVIISTPDHTHAPPMIRALRSGLHVYCEKPLTHTVEEARLAAEAAKANHCVTQIGTQIHAGDNYRRTVELVKSGAIGPVGEVHVWLQGTVTSEGSPIETPPVPSTLDYDLWLGPARWRRYSPEFLPGVWRAWWDFGNGMLGDFGCHYMDLPFWALDLKYPTRVEAEGPPLHLETTPHWLSVRYEFPKRGELPPVTMTWHHGGRKPMLAAEGPLAGWANAVLFVGRDGMLAADYNRHLLLPEETFRDFEAPKPFIAPSVGHHQEWIEACKTGERTTCPFDYSGPLTEMTLLGNVAYRVGKRLEWDATRLTATNCPEADEYVRKDYRKDWEL